MVNAAPNIVNKLKVVNRNCDINPNFKSMYITNVSTEEVFNLLCKQKNKSSSGVDEVPSKVLMYCSLELCFPLSFIVNNSLRYGIFPECLKSALVKPLFKKGDPKNVENYRPISLLSSFSKIFEAAMCNRIVNFL